MNSRRVPVNLSPFPFSRLRRGGRASGLSLCGSFSQAARRTSTLERLTSQYLFEKNILECNRHREGHFFCRMPFPRKSAIIGEKEIMA